MQGARRAGEPTDTHPASARDVYPWEETVDCTDDFELRVPLPRPNSTATLDERADAGARVVHNMNHVVPTSASMAWPRR